jgi:predicted nucleic acid-binding protein
LEIIDSRFLVEYFFSRDDEFKSKASKRLALLAEKRMGILPTIVLTETIRYVCEKRGAEEAAIRYLALVRSGLKVMDLDGRIARDAGLLKCRYPNVPTGDCIVASVARASKAKILSDDKHFDEIKGTMRSWL